jgi:Queuosine biosynthesis protein
MIRLLESLPFIWSQISQKDIFSHEVQQWWNDCYDVAKCYEATRIEYLATQDSALQNDITLQKQYCFVHIREESPLSIVFDSSLFIYHGYVPCVATAMITNFHLPESTLLMMVSALHTKNRVDMLYAHAITQGYRFYSFGDGCYLEF